MKHFFVLFSLMLLFASCTEKEDDNCESREKAWVKVVSAPTTGVVNQNVKFDLTFNVGNGCGSFDKIEEAGTSMDKKLTVYAKYVGCNCTQDAPTISTSYNFKPSVAGNYSLTFQTGDNKFDIFNVKVN